MTDYHKLLRLKPGASVKEIRKAYKNFAFHFHPDRNREKGELFLVVQQAYEELMKRAREPGYSGKSGSRKEKEHSKTAEKTSPRPVSHDLSFVKARIVKKKRGDNIYTFRRPKVALKKKRCQVCNGYGVIENRFNLASNCPHCNGTGRKTRTHL